MELKKSLQKIYSKDFFILLGIGFLPLVWKVLEIALLAGFENSLKILGQLTLISIIFKIFEESILNPLYKSLSKNNLNNEEDKICIAKKFLIFYFFAAIIFTAIVFILNEYIVKISQVPNYIFNDVLTFFKIYIISSGIGILSKYLYTFNLITKDTKKMFVYFIIKALGTAILLLILVPKFGFGLSAHGVAITELIVNTTTLCYLYFTFPKTTIKNTTLNKKEYFKLLLYSFLETAIRNIIYYCVILVFLNMLDSQDLYFVSNEYIWSFMLVPALAQNSLVKQEISNNAKSSLKPYFINCTILLAYMILLLPLSLLLFKTVYMLPNYLDYFYVLLKLFPCYIIFIFDSVIEGYFFSTGKLHHILIQNLLTNIGVYLTSLILLLCNVWAISLDAIIILFNAGVIVSSVYTIIAYYLDKNRTQKEVVTNNKFCNN